VASLGLLIFFVFSCKSYLILVYENELKQIQKSEVRATVSDSTEEENGI
jgi:hypothetical protein